MSRVKIAIVGIGNCASALLQGLELYKKQGESESVGLIAYELAGIKPEDIEVTAAFDVNEKKVGKDLSEAIFEEPNNTIKISDVPFSDVEVMRGPVLDGVGKYTKDVVRISDDRAVDVSEAIKDSGAEILVSYLPVGSSEATALYAGEALKSNSAFINSMPVFIASEKKWQTQFQEAGLPIAGDDVMSQLGATVLHKSLVKLFVDRGVKIDETYQLNIGGDTDFLNMREEERLEQKRESKTSAVRAMANYDIPTRIGPSDYVEFLQNDKVAYLWIKGRYFGNMPVTLDIKLHVVDAYNSAGVMIDAIRASKLALNRGISGPLVSASAYCFKHPPVQMPYNEAKKVFMEFVDGKRDN